MSEQFQTSFPDPGVPLASKALLHGMEYTKFVFFSPNGVLALDFSSLYFCGWSKFSFDPIF